MSYTVGFDFGTHQTKICIENATNANQKLYEFFEFENRNAEKVILLPSIVQINSDNTVSYGFVDKTKVKSIPNEKNAPEPNLKYLPKPEKGEYPPKPKLRRKKQHLDWKQQLEALKTKKTEKQEPESPQKWEKRCDKIDRDYIELITKWEKKNQELEKEHMVKIKKWEREKFEILHFRYFKLASFSKEGRWTHSSFHPDIISVWYLTYILFLLQEKMGNEFFIQMGVPSGIEEFTKQESKAHILLVSAYELLEKFKSKAAFLKSSYTDLLQATTLETPFSEDDIFFKYGLKIIPEAYAGLSTLTHQNKLPIGMNLLVDIGGGTTDIAFFTINGQRPDIHSVISIHKGLNYIFEEYLQDASNESIYDLQQKFQDAKASEDYLPIIELYHSNLIKEMEKIINHIYKSFQCLNLNFSNLTNALKDRPLIYCGGGAIFQNMRAPILGFKDLNIIDVEFINIPHLLNAGIKNDLYPILATAYGLSIPIENDIELTPVESIFSHLQIRNQNKQNSDYIHGLTDI